MEVLPKIHQLKDLDYSLMLIRKGDVLFMNQTQDLSLFAEELY